MVLRTLPPLAAGEEFNLRKDFKVKAFKTYHVIPRQKLKPEYVGRPANEIRDLRLSGVEITNTTTSPEITFTADTMADFIVDQSNADVLRAKILVMECTFLENSITVEHAKKYGHTHLAEVVKYAEMFQNKANLIHFSARYQVEMLLHMEIPWVIIGHSDRRAFLNETNKFVGDKVAYALSKGLKVIACVRETLDQR